MDLFPVVKKTAKKRIRMFIFFDAVDGPLALFKKFTYRGRSAQHVEVLMTNGYANMHSSVQERRKKGCWYMTRRSCLPLGAVANKMPVTKKIIFQAREYCRRQLGAGEWRWGRGEGIRLDSTDNWLGDFL